MLFKEFIKKEMEMNQRLQFGGMHLQKSTGHGLNWEEGIILKRNHYNAWHQARLLEVIQLPNIYNC